MNHDTILVIDDDGDVSLAVKIVLERAGWRVVTALDGREGLRAFHAERPDLVVIDVKLPGDLSGWDVLERVRDMSDVPVLLLSALSLESDKVRGFQAGADDYLTKPFGHDELRARVQALLRRARTNRPPAKVYVDDRIEVRFDAHEVYVDDRRVDLTPLEFRLLSALVRSGNRTMSTKQLLEAAWQEPHGAVGADRVKFGILRLRRKLHWDASEIESVRGFGYRYVPPAP